MMLSRLNDKVRGHLKVLATASCLSLPGDAVAAYYLAGERRPRVVTVSRYEVVNAALVGVY
jgi:hypothetical protein